MDELDFIKSVKDEISRYQRLEEECRIKRDALTQLLDKVMTKDSKENSTHIPTVLPIAEMKTLPLKPTPKTEMKSLKIKSPKGVKKRTIRNSKHQLSSEIVNILSDDKEWRLADIHQELKRRLGREVANSSLRDAIKSDDRIKKLNYGLYKLSQISSPENPIT